LLLFYIYLFSHFYLIFLILFIFFCLSSPFISFLGRSLRRLFLLIIMLVLSNTLRRFFFLLRYLTGLIILLVIWQMCIFPLILFDKMVLFYISDFLNRDWAILLYRLMLLIFLMLSCFLWIFNSLLLFFVYWERRWISWYFLSWFMFCFLRFLLISYLFSRFFSYFFLGCYSIRWCIVINPPQPFFFFLVFNFLVLLI